MGATMLMQDDDTGLIRYSLCNSNSTPVLPEDKSITLPLFEPKPKKGSPLAGVGWFDNTQTQVSAWKWAGVFVVFRRRSNKDLGFNMVPR